MLLHIPEVLSADELRQARQLLAQATWEDGQTTAGTQAAQVKHNQQLRPDSVQAQALQALVTAALQRQPIWFSAALPQRLLAPMFNRYTGPSQHYGNHVDQAIRRHGPGGERLRTDISSTLFLSDPAHYDGGELVIEDSFGPQRVKLPAGDLVLYPASSVHRVEPVTRGERLASFFWVQSLVRSAEQRRLLFDLDMALMALRQRHGDGAETVTLAGVYHNLLRQWASP